MSQHRAFAYACVSMLASLALMACVGLAVLAVFGEPPAPTAPPTPARDLNTTAPLMFDRDAAP